MVARRTARRLSRTAAIVLLATAITAVPSRAQTHAPSHGPGGPILVVADPADPFGHYAVFAATAATTSRPIPPRPAVRRACRIGIRLRHGGKVIAHERVQVRAGKRVLARARAGLA